MQQEIIEWATQAPTSKISQKRRELKVLLSHALYGNEADLKKAIKILDDELADRAYQQHQTA